MPEIKFGANVEDLKAAIGQVNSSIDSIRGSLNGLADAFGVALSVAGIKYYIASISELVNKITSIEASLGFQNQPVVELSGFAKLTGTTLEELSTQVERMSLNIQKSTKDDINPAAQALKVLGLNARELIGLPADQYFLKLADAVSKFNPSLNLTNAVMAIGGRGLHAIMPQLVESGAAVEMMGGEVQVAWE